jgi:hypothetical protein
MNRKGFPEWIDGRLVLEDTRGMTSPVQCAHCGQIYDLGTVTVIARYADCSMWKSPCCNLMVDDRGETGWKPTKDYYPLHHRVVPGR